MVKMAWMESMDFPGAQAKSGRVETLDPQDVSALHAFVLLILPLLSHRPACPVFSPSLVPGRRGPRGDAGAPGSRGRRGVPGAQGLQGPAGPAGSPASPATSEHTSAIAHEEEEVEKGTSTGLSALWYSMPSLKQLPSNSQYIRAKPVRKTTVPSLNFASSENEFANSGLKTNFAARFEGYQPHVVFVLRLKPLSCPQVSRRP